MITSVEIIDRLRRERKMTYTQMAAQFGITRSSFNDWRHGRVIMTDFAARRSAEMLGLNPAHTVACIEAERRLGTEMYPLWRLMAEALRKMEPPKKKFSAHKRLMGAGAAE